MLVLRPRNPHLHETVWLTVVLASLAMPFLLSWNLAPAIPAPTYALTLRAGSGPIASTVTNWAGVATVLWSRLSVRTFGGTIEGWTRLQSDGALIEAAAPNSPPPVRKQHGAKEHAVVDYGAGYIIVTRSAPSGSNVANALSLDVLVLPGGVPIDEPIVRIPELWTADGKPLADDALHIELVPVRHAPGYDTIEATVTLDYVLWQRRASGVCRSSAQVRTTVADRDAVRPPLWDLGVSSINGPRRRWLALGDPAAGVFRAIFDSPTAATSFANWIRATHATQAGPYRLGLFEREGREPLRPLTPVDREAMETFRALTAADAEALRTGPLGEP
jgi:hypothetical protein